MFNTKQEALDYIKAGYESTYRYYKGENETYLLNFFILMIKKTFDISNEEWLHLKQNLVIPKK